MLIPCAITDYVYHQNNGESAEVRTQDLPIKSRLLSQLSYGFVIWWSRRGRVVTSLTGNPALPYTLKATP